MYKILSSLDLVKSEAKIWHCKEYLSKFVDSAGSIDWNYGQFPRSIFIDQ